MDDTLRAAIEKRRTTAFEDQFNKSFRKVYGITPDIESIEADRTVAAHGERWALDGHNWLLVYLNNEWLVATVEVFGGGTT